MEFVNFQILLLFNEGNDGFVETRLMFVRWNVFKSIDMTSDSTDSKVTNHCDFYETALNFHSFPGFFFLRDHSGR